MGQSKNQNASKEEEEEAGGGESMMKQIVPPLICAGLGKAKVRF